MDFVRLLRGIIFSVLWYFSIFFGFLLFYCPAIFVLLFSNYAFRVITDKVFAFWELYPTALLQMLFKTKIYVHGDYIDPKETSLILVNHRTRVDWNYLWLCMFHATRKPKSHSEFPGKSDGVPNGNFPFPNGSANHREATKQKASGFNFFNIFDQSLRLKYVLKDEIRHIPGPGWVMQMNCYTYIKREWEHDQAEIKSIINYLCDMDYKHQILIFPEGTDLTVHSIKKSDAIAKKYNMPLYRQVLHPRTRGFVSLVQLLRPNLESVYDITIGYENLKKATQENVETCCLKDIATGRFPTGVHFYIRKYSIKSLPEDDDMLVDWLNKIWQRKEERLESFYTYKKFIDAPNFIQHQDRIELGIAFAFWTSLVICFPIALYKYCALRWIVAMLCCTFVLINIFTGGFHHLEISYQRLKRGRIKKMF